LLQKIRSLLMATDPQVLRRQCNKLRKKTASMPEWWQAGTHDEALVQAVGSHGFSEEIWQTEAFAEHIAKAKATAEKAAEAEKDAEEAAGGEKDAGAQLQEAEKAVAEGSEKVVTEATHGDAAEGDGKGVVEGDGEGADEPMPVGETPEREEDHEKKPAEAIHQVGVDKEEKTNAKKKRAEPKENFVHDRLNKLIGLLNGNSPASSKRQKSAAHQKAAVSLASAADSQGSHQTPDAAWRTVWEEEDAEAFQDEPPSGSMQGCKRGCTSTTESPPKKQAIGTPLASKTPAEANSVKAKKATPLSKQAATPSSGGKSATKVTPLASTKAVPTPSSGKVMKTITSFFKPKSA